MCEYENIQKLDVNPEPENNSGEFQAIKLHKCKGFNSTKIVVNCYRSPSRNPESFISLLEKFVHNLSRHSKKHVILAGGFNCDLIKHDNNIVYQNLINTMSQCGFLQIISRPTRITDNSATLIDHVYTNDVENTLSCNIITTDISDHLGTLTTISLDGSLGAKISMQPKHDKNANREYRIFNESNNQKFKELIDS